MYFIKASIFWEMSFPVWVCVCKIHVLLWVVVKFKQHHMVSKFPFNDSPFIPFVSQEEDKGASSYQKDSHLRISMVCSVCSIILCCRHIRGYLQLLSTPWTADPFPLPRISLLSTPISLSPLCTWWIHTCPWRSSSNISFLLQTSLRTQAEWAVASWVCPRMFEHTLPLALLILFSAAAYTSASPSRLWILGEQDLFISFPYHQPETWVWNIAATWLCWLS